IEDSYNSTIEDFYDSTIEALQDLKDSQNSQDSTQKETDDLKMKGITLQKKKRAAPYIEDSNSKVFKPFKIPINDPEKLNYT
ncbi:23781_t:CDS:2, partial [Gigaspora rosea]